MSSLAVVVVLFLTAI